MRNRMYERIDLFGCYWQFLSLDNVESRNTN